MESQHTADQEAVSNATPQEREGEAARAHRVETEKKKIMESARAILAETLGQMKAPDTQHPFLKEGETVIADFDAELEDLNTRRAQAFLDMHNAVMDSREAMVDALVENKVPSKEQCKTLMRAKRIHEITDHQFWVAVFDKADAWHMPVAVRRNPEGRHVIAQMPENPASDQTPATAAQQ